MLHKYAAVILSVKKDAEFFTPRFYQNCRPATISVKFQKAVTV